MTKILNYKENDSHVEENPCCRMRGRHSARSVRLLLHGLVSGEKLAKDEPLTIMASFYPAEVPGRKDRRRSTSPYLLTPHGAGPDLELSQDDSLSSADAVALAGFRGAVSR